MKILRYCERAFVILSLLYFAGGLIPSALAEGQQDPFLRRVSLAMQLVIYAVLVLMLLIHREAVLRSVRSSGWLIALCGLVLMSAAWSSDPMFTLRRGILLLLTTTFAIYFASAFEWPEQMSIFGWMSLLAVVGSFVMVGFFPEYGLSHDLHVGDWKGLFAHKNIMGRQMAFAIITLAVIRPARMPWSIRWGAIAGAGTLLYMSHSATALASLTICAAAYPLLHLLRVKGKKTLPIWVPFLPLVGVAVVIAVANADTFLAILGRNSSLTGRTSIWKHAIEGISQEPWFGHGFNAFWGRSMSHSHDGYLDLLLDVGIVGLLVFAALLVQTLTRAFRFFQTAESTEAKWPALFVILFMVYNIAESSIFRQRTFLWIPFVAISVSLGAFFQEERSEALQPARTPEFNT